MDPIFESYKNAIIESTAVTIITVDTPKTHQESGWYAGKWSSPTGTTEVDVIKAIKDLHKVKSVGLFDNRGQQIKKVPKVFNTSGTWEAK